MKPIECINKNWSVLHLIDADRYSRVSRSKTLCGKPGKEVWIPHAAYWRPPNKKCSKCFKLAKEGA